jgi:glutamate 5-kinase
MSAPTRRVIKIGSSLLVDPAGRVRRDWLHSLAADLAACCARGQAVLVVTSGAIALGRAMLGLGPGGLRLEEKQAAAAVGQINLPDVRRRCLRSHAGADQNAVLPALRLVDQRCQFLAASAKYDG